MTPKTVNLLYFTLFSACEAKLNANAHKEDNWEQMPLDWLFSRLCHEVIELRVALGRGLHSEVRDEVGDVANYAAMILSAFEAQGDDGPLQEAVGSGDGAAHASRQ